MGLSDDELERRLRGDDSKIKEEQEVFRRIRDYIREHPGANAAEISRATGIDQTVIFRLINQGKLLKKD